MKVNIIKYLCLTCICILLLAGCPPVEESFGKLILALGKAGQRTIAPDYDTEPCNFVIMLKGPGEETLSRSSGGGMEEFPGLSCGQWNIAISAFNLAGELIGTGTATALVSAGQSTTSRIDINPLAGEGTFRSRLSWDPDQLVGENNGELSYTTPSITARFSRTWGEDISLEYISLKPGEAECNNSHVPAGYYTLTIMFFTNGEKIKGFRESVRIFRNQTTTGNFENIDFNLPYGTLIIEVDADTSPIEITIDGQKDRLNLGNNMTLQASVPPDTGNVTYTWTLEGEIVGMDANLIVLAEKEGTFSVTVTAVRADGRREGSRTHRFAVITGSIDGLITINGAHAYTNRALVDLTILANDLTGQKVEEMMVANNALFASTAWEPFAAVKSWRLEAGLEETKHVYVKFRNTSYMESMVFEAAIILTSYGYFDISRFDEAVFSE